MQTPRRQRHRHREAKRDLQPIRAALAAGGVRDAQGFAGRGVGCPFAGDEHGGEQGVESEVEVGQEGLRGVGEQDGAGERGGEGEEVVAAEGAEADGPEGRGGDGHVG